MNKARVVTLTAIAVAVLTAGTAEARPAPAGFYGVVSQSTSFSDSDIKRLKRSGAGAVRFVLPWQTTEVTPGNFRWGAVDAKIDAIREAGAEPLPTLYGVAPWLGLPGLPPLGNPLAELGWQQFLTRVVERYGPGGTRAEADPNFEPITAWQIWNEPNIPAFWGGGDPSAREYTRLMRLSARAIGGADPGAELIAAGLSPATRGVAPPKFLAQVYRRYDKLGLPPDFDHVALNPYARSIRESRRKVKRFSDSAKRATGKRPRLMIAEIGWASGGPKRHPVTTTRRRQAKRVSDVFRLFERKRKRWRISSVSWYAWQDLPPSAAGCPFCGHAGLFDFKGRAKPAWKAFRKVTRRAR